MKYCSTCGAQIPADAKVCPVCGAALAPAAAPTTSAATYTFNIPSLICAAIALLLFFVAPYGKGLWGQNITYFDSLKAFMSDLDGVFEYFTIAGGNFLFVLVNAVAIVLCIVFSFTNNKSAAIKSAAFGIGGTVVALFLNSFLPGNELGVPFGDILSAFFESFGELAFGFWLILIAFVGVIVSNKMEK